MNHLIMTLQFIFCLESNNSQSLIFTHAMRYINFLDNGVEVNRWTSKVGSFGLIGHGFNDLIHNRYGNIMLYGKFLQ